MLELAGYIESDLAATFAVRMPGESEQRIVSVAGGALAVRDLDVPLMQPFDAHRDAGVAGPGLPGCYLLFRRVEEGGVVKFVIEDARVPILG